MDEPYIKIESKWHYLYRAFDKKGHTTYFILSKKRDEITARNFFEKAIISRGLPEKITIDKSGANKARIEAINLQIALIALLGCPFIQIYIHLMKYLNNSIEHAHRGIKRIVNPMLGLNSFNSAQATNAGIELFRMLKKRSAY